MNNAANRHAMTLAVIMAAGRGSRIADLPENVNKCAFPIRDGISPVFHMAGMFIANGVTRLAVTVGHASDSVRTALAPLRGFADISFVENPFYASTGCNYSLARALEAVLTDDIHRVVVVEGDSLFPSESIGQMISPPCPAAVLLRPESYINSARSFVALGRDDMVTRFCYDPKHRDVLATLLPGEGETILGESMDIWSFGEEALNPLKEQYLAFAKDPALSRGPFFSPAFLASLAAAGLPMRPVPARRPSDWINMNTRSDIEKAAKLSWLTDPGHHS